MSRKTKRRIAALLIGLGAMFGLGSCSDINEADAPVALVSFFDSTILVLDLADEDCGTSGLGTLTINSVIKQANPTRTDFLDVQLKTMRITYSRNDGGTVVPDAFTQSISGLISAGTGGEVSGFLAFQPGAFIKAPFVSLLPSNGGFDPETGDIAVGLELTIEVFGETLGGDKVSTTTRFPLSVCIGCGCGEV